MNECACEDNSTLKVFQWALTKMRRKVLLTGFKVKRTQLTGIKNKRLKC
jgi:hypothetical protein